MSLRKRVAGHLWTIGPTVRHRLLPLPFPDARSWRYGFDDPDVGSVELHGALREEGGASSLVVLLHGLGGTPESAYLVPAANAAACMGLSCLRVGMRGSNRTGDDLYHAGLTADIAHIIQAPRVAQYPKIFVIGFSLGGHIALRSSLDLNDERLAGVAAICSPLDLREGQRSIDAPARAIYRKYVLRELIASYEAIDARGRAPTPAARVRQTKSILEWDALTVVRRFGFESVDHYYESMSVIDELHALTRPALIISSTGDPMISMDAVRGARKGAGEAYEMVVLEDGGHVFLPDMDLGIGQPADATLMEQVVGWLESSAQ